LKNQPQPSATIRNPVQNVDITKTPFIATKGVLMKKAFLGLFRLNAVIAQMLDVSVFLALIIPFELSPAISRHDSPATLKEGRARSSERAGVLDST